MNSKKNDSTLLLQLVSSDLLHYRPAIATVLINHGASVNVPNKYLETPLYLACQEGFRKDLLKVFLEAPGVDPTAKDVLGVRPFDQCDKDGVARQVIIESAHSEYYLATTRKTKIKQPGPSMDDWRNSPYWSMGALLSMLKHAGTCNAKKQRLPALLSHISVDKVMQHIIQHRGANTRVLIEVCEALRHELDQDKVANSVKYIRSLFSGGFTHHYTTNTDIGTGSFGYITPCVCIIKGQNVTFDCVMKHTIIYNGLATTDKAQSEKYAVQEATVMTTLYHPNVLPLYHWRRVRSGDVEAMQLFVPHMSMNGVEFALVLGKNYNIREVVIFLFKCARAMDYLHRKNVVHRDIKLDNFMLNLYKADSEDSELDTLFALYKDVSDNNNDDEEPGVSIQNASDAAASPSARPEPAKYEDVEQGRYVVGEVVAIDFGYSRKMPVQSTRRMSTLTKQVGSVVYMAPEMCSNDRGSNDRGRYTFKTDVYSFGVMMFLLFSLDLPYDDKQWYLWEDTYTKNFTECVKERCKNDKIAVKLVEIVTNCTKRRDQDRFSSEQLLSALENVLELL